MRKSLACAAMVATLAFAATPSRAEAAVELLNLIDPPAGEVSYDLSFIANNTTTTLSVGGYQVPASEIVQYNDVTSGGGSNLLGGVWTYVGGSGGTTFNDGTSVPGLQFAGATGGDYDIFSQTFSTTPGTRYYYSFTFLNDYVSEPSGLLVTTTASPAPEPSTWAMLFMGFVGLALAGFRARRSTVPAAP